MKVGYFVFCVPTCDSGQSHKISSGGFTVRLGVLASNSSLNPCRLRQEELHETEASLGYKVISG